MGNLPQAYDSNMLRQLFSQHAEVVHAAVITEPGSNLSKGFGFIHIPDPAKVSSSGATGRQGGLSSGSHMRHVCWTACMWARQVGPEENLLAARAAPSAVQATARKQHACKEAGVEGRCVQESNKDRSDLPLLCLCVSQAKEVRDMLDGTIIDGRPLAVRLRTERKEDRGPREGGRGPPGAPVPGAAGCCCAHAVGSCVWTLRASCVSEGRLEFVPNCSVGCAAIYCCAVLSRAA